MSSRYPRATRVFRRSLCLLGAGLVLSLAAGIDSADAQADLSAQRFPAGGGHVILADGAAAIARARERVRFWDDDADREFALAVLRDLTRNVENGQEQLFLRASDWHQDTAQRALFEVLTAR